MFFSANSCCFCQLITADGVLRSVLTVFAAAVLTTSPIQAQSEPATGEVGTEDESWGKPRDLLKDDLKTCWQHFSSVNQTVLPNVWRRVVSDDQSKTELICTGDPRGYLYTSQQFDEFNLNFEWRYVSDPNGNSGVLVFTQNDRRLWPTSIQVQLHQPEAGSVFPSGDAVTEFTVRKEGLAKPVGEWNKCQIVSRAGRLLVHINGEKSGEVTGCRPASGRIAIQSEGSEVHFRRIMIRTPAALKEKVTNEEKSGEAAVNFSDEQNRPSQNSGC